MKRIFGKIIAQIAILFCFTFPALATDSLQWRTNQNRVDAEIKGWSLPTLLEKVSAATGWEIYMEPTASHTVSTKFKDLPSSEALKLLLGNLNYALVHKTNAVSKFYVFRTSQKGATQLIRKANLSKNRLIPNELIVTLKPGSIGIDELAKQLGAKVVGRIDELNAYRLSFEDEAAAKAARELLKDNDDVAEVDSNYSVDRPSPVDVTGLKNSDGYQLKPRINTGDQTVVALIDTGLGAVGDDLAAYLLPGLSVMGDTVPNGDGLTHGNSMAQILAQALDGKNIKILPIDVYGLNGSTTSFEIGQGAMLGMKGGAMFYNMSLGGPGESIFLRSIVQDIRAQGGTVFAAAGNEPTASPVYPAAWPEVNAVTAGNSDGSIANYANYGSFIDIIAPSKALVKSGGNYYVITGTSVSTAIVTGTAANKSLSK